MGSSPIVRVLSPGFLTTVQDLGRPGYAHLGISASGAADAFSLRVGNLLVGNSENTPALEITLTGGEVDFDSSNIVAITGSDFAPAVDREMVPLWVAFEVRAGQRIRLAATKSGARCYLCLRGGFDVPRVFGSSSTHLVTRLGGIEGRALRKWDMIPLNPMRRSKIRSRRVERSAALSFLQRDRIRVTESLQSSYFGTDAWTTFLRSPYAVTEESDRMGLRLSGATLKPSGPVEILTEGIPLGAIQVPENGSPILSFVEHQTTGGYPKIANVISADLQRVGQLRPRDNVSFELVTMEGAMSLLRERESFIQTLREGRI